MINLFGLAILAAAVSICVSEQPLPPNSASASQPASVVLELTELIAPRELVLQTKLREFDRNFGPSLLLNDDIKAIEAEFPGSIAAIVAATRPLMAKQPAKLVESVQQELASFLAIQFSSQELAELKNFYGSAHGKSMVGSAADSVDQSKSYRSTAETGTVSEETLDLQRAEAIKSTLGKLSGAEAKALLAFAETPTFAKLKLVRPKIREMISKTMGASDRVYDKQVELAIDAALEAHIASSKAKARN